MLNKRASGHPFVRYLSLLLARLEHRHGFMTYAYYVNTKHNVLADDLSRLYLEVSREELQQRVDELHPGLVRVARTALLDFLLDEEHGTNRSFALPGDGPDVIALRLKEARRRQKKRRKAVAQDVARGLSPQTCPPPLGGVVEVFGGVAAYSVAAGNLGMVPMAMIEGDGPSRAFAADRLGSGAASFAYARLSKETKVKVKVIFMGGLLGRASAKPWGLQPRRLVLSEGGGGGAEPCRVYCPGGPPSFPPSLCS